MSSKQSPIQCVPVAYEPLFILMSSDQSGNCVQRGGDPLQAALQTAGEGEEAKACQQGLLLKRLAARNQRQVQSERSHVWKNNEEQREKCFVFSPDRLHQGFIASQQ